MELFGPSQGKGYTVVEGPCEVLCGKGPLGKERWEGKYVIFERRTHRFEVHDPFDPTETHGGKRKPKAGAGAGTGAGAGATYAFEKMGRVLSGTAEYKVQGMRKRLHR